ncbi:MAG TPA: hypothetical protein VK860_12600 [Ilumatobacteraceae bacterium]|nr:hypothetical protein [Ilumatobacteraceae bacterium]
MFKSTRKSKMVKVAAAAAAVGSIAAIGFVGNSPVQADPKQFDAFVVVGSDTTQDVLNGYAGFSNGINFTPVQSSVATGQRQIASWNAGAASCIAVKTGAPLILRPNGSSGGRRALSRAALGEATWGTGSVCGASDLTGLIDFARSSATPVSGDTGTDLTYIPFGRDALSWGYYRNTGAPVTDMTTAQLNAIFATGAGIVGGVPIIPCGIQTSSGTYQSWNSTVSVNQATETDSTKFCNDLLGVPDPIGRLQEHSGPELKIKGDLIVSQSHPDCDGVAGGTAVSCANVQVIVGFSASQFVARSNGLAVPAPGPGVGLGGVNGSSAVSGTAPSVTPVESFYASGLYGRDVYNVFVTDVINDPFNAQLQSLFVGPTSSVCNDATDVTTERFGFLAIDNCGDTSLKGSFFSGNS